MIEVSDIVYWESSPNTKYTIEKVREDGWIWSSDFQSPYCNDGTLNYYNPKWGGARLINPSEKIRMRELKLKELGI